MTSSENVCSSAFRRYEFIELIPPEGGTKNALSLFQGAATLHESSSCCGSVRRHRSINKNGCFNSYCAKSSKSSMLGNSVRSFSPNWIINSFDVPYIIGRPTVSFLPLVTINRFSSKVLIAEEEVTPRISRISGIVIGCLYAITASVSSAGKDSRADGRDFRYLRINS